MKSWVVVASSTRARFFEMRNRRKPLLELFDLVNPEERLHTRDLKSDKPGRGLDRRGGQHHAVQRPVDPKEQSAIRFAKEVIDRLHSSCHKGEFDRLCVVAAPHFLGLLRERMDPMVKRVLAGEVNKDLTREDLVPIAEHIAQVM